MSRLVALSALLSIAALSRPAAADDGPDWFIAGGPGVGHTSDLILPGRAETRSPVSAEPGQLEPMDTGPDSRVRLMMLGVGMTGTEGPFRGGAELLNLFGRRGDATSGYSAFVTYAGGDFGAGFVQTGLGLGAFWGGDRRGLDRIAGAAHGEIGVRLSRSVALLVRGDLLIGDEIVNPIGSVGLQWIPGEQTARPRARQTSPLEGCCPAI